MSEYFYLVSSLPMLKQDEESAISSEEFLDACSQWLKPGELSLIKQLNLAPIANSALSPASAAGKWNNWETCLRNFMTRTRAGKLNRDTANSLREEKDFFSEIERGAQDAFSAPNPLEREKMLDKLRWTQLEDLESGHHFDFDKLCIYRIKLLLREKWTNRKKEQGEENLNGVVEKVYAGTENKEEENKS
jgi:hypothetical protein